MKHSFLITVIAFAFFWGAASVRAQVFSATPSATIKPTPKTTLEPVCGKLCIYDTDCGNGYTCTQGVCRLTACTSDATCRCSILTPSPIVATDSGKGKGNPETGAELWIGAAGFVFLGWLGLKLRRSALNI